MKRSVFNKAVKRSLKNDNYFKEIDNEYEKAKSAAIQLFCDKDCNSNDAKIIREVLFIIKKKGFIKYEKEPTIEEKYMNS